ncbi:HTH_Tnp_Tc3_2 domain-containing protein [Trichonephila clavipes]|nr:HTH_Tnp_Tc3_2 domain-containing protein [Trichonephila clavipes]
MATPPISTSSIWAWAGRERNILQHSAPVISAATTLRTFGPSDITGTNSLNDGVSRTVSKQTVQRPLHLMGFGSRRPTRVPLLNARHLAAHLDWAREYRDWSVKDWNLTNIWQVIPVERSQKLVESMPSCVAAVIKARRGPTRY